MRFTDKLVLITVCILISFSGRADTTGSDGEAKAQHIKEMGDLKISNPTKYESVYKMALIQIKMLLGRLGYDVGPFDLAFNDRVVSAIKAYEKNRGIPITGDPLAYETFRQVSKDLDLVNTNHVYPGDFSFTDFMWDYGYLLAEGTWIIVGDSQSEPEQTTTISCRRSEDKCYAATATKGGGSSGYISSTMEIYEVERWDNFEIVTKPYDYRCTRYVIRLNRVQKSVIGIRSKVSNSKECKVVEDKEFTLKLVDGGEAIKELRQNHHHEMLKLHQLSSDAQKVLTEGP